MMVNYDYHFTPWFQVYGFVERFSNSYLSIKQRYEIGTGISFELDLFNKEKIDKELNSIRSKSEEDYEKFKNIYGNITDALYEEFRTYLDNLPDDTPVEKHAKYLISSKFEDLEKEEKRIKQAFKKKYAKLSVGLAISLFSELEQAEINVYFDEERTVNGVETIQATETTSITLDMEHKFRFVLRPLVVFRPSDDLTLMAFKYFKCPLGSPTENGERDYRTDALIRAEFELKKAAGWAEKLSFILEYQRHYDNLPPFIPQSKIDEKANEGKFLRGDGIAEKIHDEFKFVFKISF